MWESEKEHLRYLADEISKLEKRACSNGFLGYIGGFFSGVGFVFLMWLLHR